MLVPEVLEAVREALPFGDLIESIERTPVAERVQRLTLNLSDGTQEICICKSATVREQQFYERILTPEETGSPVFYGASPWPDGEGSYLFLEDLPEYFMDPESTRDVVAAFRHLGQMHKRFLNRDLPPMPEGSKWAISADEVQATFEALPQLRQWAADSAPKLSVPPQTLLHGDYQRWNVLVDCEDVRVLDWEHAAAGHPIWDLSLVVPEEETRDSVLGGIMADLALRIYHSQGPFSAMSYLEFEQLHALFRIFLCARRVMQYKARLAESPSGPSEVIRVHIRREEEMIRRLGKRLQWW